MSFFDSSSRFQSNKSSNLNPQYQPYKVVGKPGVATYNITIPIQTKNPSISQMHLSPNFIQDYRNSTTQLPTTSSCCSSYSVHDKLGSKRLSTEPLTIEELQRRLNIKSATSTNGQIKRPASRASLMSSPTSQQQYSQQTSRIDGAGNGCQTERDYASCNYNPGDQSQKCELEDENETSNLGACQECFQETLNRIQSERMIITREINLNIKNLKQKETLKSSLVEKNQKKLMMRRNSQGQLASSTEKSLNGTCNSSKSFNIMDQQYFKKLIKNVSLKETFAFQQQQQSTHLQQQQQYHSNNINTNSLNIQIGMQDENQYNERKTSFVNTKKPRQPIVTQINLPIKPKTSLNSPIKSIKQQQSQLNTQRRSYDNKIISNMPSSYDNSQEIHQSQEKSKNSIQVIENLSNQTVISNGLGGGASIIEEAKNFGKYPGKKQQQFLVNKGPANHRNKRLSMGDLSRGAGNSVVQSYKQQNGTSLSSQQIQSHNGSKSSRIHNQVEKQIKGSKQTKIKQNLPGNQSSIMTTMETTLRTMSTMNKSQSVAQINSKKNQKENQNPKVTNKQTSIKPLKLTCQNSNIVAQGNKHIRTKSGVVLSTVILQGNNDYVGELTTNKKSRDSVQTNLYEKIYKKLDSSQYNDINNGDFNQKKLISIETNYLLQNNHEDEYQIYNDSLNILSNKSCQDSQVVIKGTTSNSYNSQVNLNTSDQIIQQSFNMINQDLQQYNSSILESQSPIYNNSLNHEDEISNQLKERLIKGLESCYICLTDEDEQAIASLRDLEKESDKSKIQNTRNNKDSYLYGECDLHTCSSDEQMKTGEVTLENPQFNMTQIITSSKSQSQFQQDYVLNQEHQNNIKKELSQYMMKHPNPMNNMNTLPLISKQDCNKLYGPGSFYYQPFNNISNIRETEQEDDYSVEYV